MAQTYQVRIQDDGQVTLPADVRERLGLKSGDVVDLIDTPEGLLITSRELAVTRALDGMGAVLRAEGATLEDFIESTREARPALIKELYGLEIDESGKRFR